MTTIPEFNAARDAATRRGYRPMMAIGAVAVAYGAVFVGVCESRGPAIRAAFEDRFGPVVPIFLGPLALAPAPIALVVGVYLADRRSRRSDDPRLACPACGGSLLAADRYLLVGSRLCPHCGKRALAEPAGLDREPAGGGGS